MSSPSTLDRTIPSIAAIIPVYNEAEGVKRVLEVVCKYLAIQEIIVVDDGSMDESTQLVIQAQDCDERIRLITHQKNYGKGQAVHSGLRSTQAEVIITLDADLHGLELHHLEDLVNPIVVDHLDMTIGIFRNGKFYSDFSHWATPWLSGQRCIWRKHLQGICWNAAQGYGLETAITVASIRHHWQCQKVIWQGVFHPPSEMHRGVVSGLFNRIKMYSQIGRALVLANLDHQQREN